MAPVLPTGVGVETEFGGPVELQTDQTLYPDRFGKLETCTLAPGARVPRV